LAELVGRNQFLVKLRHYLSFGDLENKKAPVYQAGAVNPCITLFRYHHRLGVKIKNISENKIW
jgi:hypothetical protein